MCLPFLFPEEGFDYDNGKQKNVCIKGCGWDERCVEEKC